MHEKTVSHLPALGLDITERTNALLAYWDKHLICRFANRAFTNWFGYRPEQMIGRMHISELMGSAFSRYSVNIFAALEGKSQTFEQTLITPSGEKKLVRVTMSPDYEEGIVKGLFAHVADISNLPGSGQRLRESAEYINGFSYNTDTKLHKVIETLRSCILEEFPGIAFLAKKHSMSESTLKRMFKEKYNTTIFSYYRDLQMELAHKYISANRCNKSQMALMLNFSNPSNFSACYKKYVNKITIKHLIGDIKKESEERYKTFVEQVPFHIAMFDTHLNYLAASKMWIDDYRMGDEQYIGKNLYDLSPGAKEKFNDVFEACLKGHIDKNDGALVERLNGASAWMRWDIRPWYTINQEIGGLIMMTEDLSEAKRIEEENKRLAYILEKANEITRIGAWQRDFNNHTVFWSNILKEILEVPQDYNPKDLDTGFKFYPEGPHRDLVEMVTRYAVEKGQEYDIETELITAKGNLKKVRIIGFPKFVNGKCEAISGIFQDITYNTAIH